MVEDNAASGPIGSVGFQAGDYEGNDENEDDDDFDYKKSIVARGFNTNMDDFLKRFESVAEDLGDHHESKLRAGSSFDIAGYRGPFNVVSNSNRQEKTSLKNMRNAYGSISSYKMLSPSNTVQDD